MLDNYKMTLAIYPLCEFDKSVNEVEPLEASYENNDIDALKESLWETVFHTMKEANASNGITFIRYDIEKNGEYFDCDEGYFRIDLENNFARFLID